MKKVETMENGTMEYKEWVDFHVKDLIETNVLSKETAAAYKQSLLNRS